MEALSLPAPAETAPSPAERDAAMPADDAFFRTIVKKIAEVSGPDGSFWWKGEVNNPTRARGPAPTGCPLRPRCAYASRSPTTRRAPASDG
ncbi:hypothetical protein ACFQ60_03925 [Streptomyces zhihengii]